jgi:hypothetical protein
MKIKETSWGVANRVGDVVLINKHLVKFPELRYHLIQHELSHNTQDDLEDVRIDIKHLMNQRPLLIYQRLLFMFLHPKSWVQMSPVFIYENKAYIDHSLLIIWGLLGLFCAMIIGGTIWI